MPAKSYEQNKDPKLTNERVVISKFLGMSPTQDPHDIDANLSAFQVNCYAVHPGELRCRPGMKLVAFTT